MGWISSTGRGHRRNILDGDWTSLGIGVATVGRAGNGTVVAVQVFTPAAHQLVVEGLRKGGLPEVSADPMASD